jgi:hypothetical protein
MYYEKKDNLGFLDPISIGAIGSGVGILANIGQQIFGANLAKQAQTNQLYAQLQDKYRQEREAKDAANQAQVQAQQQMIYSDASGKRNAEILVLTGVGAAGVLLAAILLYNATRGK